MTKVEEVARAMLDEIGNHVPGPQVEYDDATPVGEAQRKILHNIARAAIKAMHGPTQTMLVVGWDETPSNWIGKEFELVPVFNSMIDAALAEDK